MNSQIHNPEGLTAEQYEAAAGWRLLFVEELEKLPDDAEFLSLWPSRSWEESAYRGDAISRAGRSKNVYRTRTPSPHDVAAGHNPLKLTSAQVGVKDGWRLLEVGEAKPADYEWSSSIFSGEWMTECRHTGEQVLERVQMCYRTKQPKAAAEPAPAPKLRAREGWVELAARLPTDAECVAGIWLGGPTFDSVRISGSGAVLAVKNTYGVPSLSLATHWRPAEPAPSRPVVKPKTQAELDEAAYDAWRRSRLVTTVPDAFAAGIKHARSAR